MPSTRARCSKAVWLAVAAMAVTVVPFGGAVAVASPGQRVIAAGHLSRGTVPAADPVPITSDITEMGSWAVSQHNASSGTALHFAKVTEASKTDDGSDLVYKLTIQVDQPMSQMYDTRVAFDFENRETLESFELKE
jgi:hypothetical protein